MFTAGIPKKLLEDPGSGSLPPSVSISGGRLALIVPSDVSGGVLDVKGCLSGASERR
jgi:hypothetical protein